VQPQLDAKEFLDRFAYDPFDVLRNGIRPQELAGLSLVELGPGDHIPIALLALAAGARRYTAIDRFPGQISGPVALHLYCQLLEDLTTRNPEMALAFNERGLTASNFVESEQGVVSMVAEPIESVSTAVDADVVFSNNVLEHVGDIPRFVAGLHRIMAPGAVSVHRVDFGPHDILVQRSNPLEWLKLPDWLWTQMGSQRGLPNRWRYAELLAAFESAGFEATGEVVETFDDAVVLSMRDSLAGRFRTMPLESLRVRTAIIRTTRSSPPRTSPY
jgi:hypothetical protein